MPKPQLEFFNTASAPITRVHGGDSPAWEETQILSCDPDTGDATMIITLPPGYKQDGEARVHDYWEEVILLSGRLHDRALGQWFGAGYYACRPPGMVHGPYDADEHEGVRQFVQIRYPATSGESGKHVDGVDERKEQ